VKIVPENENLKMGKWNFIVRKNPEQKPLVNDGSLNRKY
jgi:hypothetical protein